MVVPTIMEPEGIASKEDCLESHGSYKLEKVLNFRSRLEKSLNSVRSLKST